MYYHLINIEESNNLDEVEDTIILYLHQYKDNGKQKMAIKVRNIYSSILIHFIDQNNLDLMKERIHNILNRLKSKEYMRFTIEKVEKRNCFFSNIPDKANYIRINFLELKNTIESALIKNIQQFSEGFTLIKEFENPLEQFFITTQIRIPCVVEICDFSIIRENGMLYIDDYMSIKHISYNFRDALDLNMAAIVTDKNSILVGIGSSRDLKPAIHYKFTDIRDLKVILNIEKVDAIIHHDLQEKFLRSIQQKGMLVINTLIAAKDTFKLRVYSISEILGVCTDRDDGVDKVSRLFEIMKKTSFLELSISLAQVCGGSFNKTLNCNRQRRIENLVFTEMYKHNVILPISNDNNSSEKYQGGLVLEPQKGYHENYCLLLDFNSLYPTIISEFNVCFTTVGRWKHEQDDDDINENELNLISERSKSCPRGILPLILDSLVSERVITKKLFQKTNESFLDIKQKALKLTANSIYGCLGFKQCRFYSCFMAKFITAKGRSILHHSVDNIPKIPNMRVIYGDTDSMMIDTGIPNKGDINQAKDIANEIVEAINKRHGRLQIECENIFKILLLYTKKKYAALVFSDKGATRLETRGVESTKSNFCTKTTTFLAKILSWIMIDMENKESLKLLYEKNGEMSYEMFLKKAHKLKNKDNPFIINAIKAEINGFQSEIYSGNIDIEDFICTKKISKHINKYDPNLDFVKYCKRLISHDIIYKKDDVIEYIYVKNQSTQVTEMYHPQIFKNSIHNELTLDIDYYIKEEVLPSITRILTFTMPREDIYECFGITITTKQIRENMETKTSFFKGFLSPCCNKPQNLSRECNQCRNQIEESFLINFFILNIKKSIDIMYSIPSDLALESCFNCNRKQNYSFIIKKCLYCGENLQNYDEYFKFCKKNNRELDELLETIRFEKSRLSIEDKEFDRYIDNITSMSQYQIIDLAQFFTSGMLPQ
ncbi:DNA polymerase alpha catalytic subunit [Cucumispora dikerogammari]|nr:DNA polymerase alpha catalytic subunit [Cucumispora dikerogammari]